MDRLRMFATVVAVTLVAAVGWGQDEGPESAKGEPTESTVPAPDSDALSDDEKAQLERISGGKRKWEMW